MGQDCREIQVRKRSRRTGGMVLLASLSAGRIVWRALQSKDEKFLTSNCNFRLEKKGFLQHCVQVTQFRYSLLTVCSDSLSFPFSRCFSVQESTNSKKLKTDTLTKHLGEMQLKQPNFVMKKKSTAVWNFFQNIISYCICKLLKIQENVYFVEFKWLRLSLTLAVS